MSSNDYIRAWKDPDYRASLSAEQRAALPEHPCAEIELSDEDLALVAGASTNAVGTAGCCQPDPGPIFTTGIACYITMELDCFPRPVPSPSGS